MKNFILLLFFLPLINCSKPKAVLICGDHICINKDEANQYFEDNLTLEVKIIDKKKDKDFNLIELNLKSNSNKKKEIQVYKKESTKSILKELSNEDIKEKKKQLKNRKIVKKKIIKKKDNKQQQAKINKKFATKIKSKPIKTVNNQNNQIVDICTLIKKCNIDEISNYLIKKGKEKKFPDISLRE